MGCLSLGGLYRFTEGLGFWEGEPTIGREKHDHVDGGHPGVGQH